MSELREASARNRFGDVVEIVKDEWVREVTDASKSCWVIVHLYQDYITECRLLENALLILASKFKYIKFLKIRSTQAVENWPEKNLPTLFLYHEGELKQQMITLKQVGGKSMKTEGCVLSSCLAEFSRTLIFLSDLEWWLASRNIVTTSELEEDPRESGERKQVTRLGVFGVRPSGSFDEDDD